MARSLLTVLPLSCDLSVPPSGEQVRPTICPSALFFILSFVYVWRYPPPFTVVIRGRPIRPPSFDAPEVVSISFGDFETIFSPETTEREKVWWVGKFFSWKLIYQSSYSYAQIRWHSKEINLNNYIQPYSPKHLPQDTHLNPTLNHTSVIHLRAYFSSYHHLVKSTICPLMPK